MSIPIVCLLSGALGASIAGALQRGSAGAGAASTHPPPSLALVLGLQFGVVLPAAAIILWRYPAWSAMYVVDLAAWGAHRMWWLAAHPVVAVAAWASARRWGRGRSVAAVLMVIALAIPSLTPRRFWWVGSQAQWESGVGGAPMPATPLGWLLLGYGMLLGGGWIAAWRRGRGRGRGLAVLSSEGILRDHPTETGACPPNPPGSCAPKMPCAATPQGPLVPGPAHPEAFEPQPAASSMVLPPPPRRAVAGKSAAE